MLVMVVAVAIKCTTARSASGGPGGQYNMTTSLLSSLINL